MNLKPNTTVVNKHIVFLKDDAGWYADMAGAKAQNPMVSGTDTMIEALSGGSRRASERHLRSRNHQQLIKEL